jgi:hypothetical protein
MTGGNRDLPSAGDAAEGARQRAWSIIGDAAEDALSVVNLPGDDVDALRRLLAAAGELGQRVPQLRGLPHPE